MRNAITVLVCIASLVVGRILCWVGKHSWGAWSQEDAEVMEIEGHELRGCRRQGCHHMQTRPLS
jgi:hypothetical protein